MRARSPPRGLRSSSGYARMPSPSAPISRWSHASAPRDPPAEIAHGGVAVMAARFSGKEAGAEQRLCTPTDSPASTRPSRPARRRWGRSRGRCSRRWCAWLSSVPRDACDARCARRRRATDRSITSIADAPSAKSSMPRPAKSIDPKRPCVRPSVGSRAKICVHRARASTRHPGGVEHLGRHLARGETSPARPRCFAIGVAVARLQDDGDGVLAMTTRKSSPALTRSTVPSSGRRSCR